jgi:nicotinamidase-related amidase
MERTGMLENTRRLVEAARGARTTIVHGPISYAPGYCELALHPYGILKGVVEAGAYMNGEWGAEIVGVLAPHESDVMVEGKRGLDSFATTNLDFIVRCPAIPSRVRLTTPLGFVAANCWCPRDATAARDAVAGLS